MVTIAGTGKPDEKMNFVLWDIGNRILRSGHAGYDIPLPLRGELPFNDLDILKPTKKKMDSSFRQIATGSTYHYTIHMTTVYINQ